MGACQSVNGGASQGDILSNSDSNTTNLDSVKKVINDHSNSSSVNTTTVQEVSVIPSPDFDDSLAKLKCNRYNFLGMWVGESRPYGASYGVSQNTDIKIVTLQKEIADRKTDIYNSVSSKIAKDLKAKLSTPSGRNTVDDAINSTRDSTSEKIESYLTQEAEKTLDQTQKVEIVYNRPLRYTGECGCTDCNPQIKQNIVIDVVAQNIVNMITSDIQKKLSTQESKNKLDFDSTGGDMACEEQIGIGVIACLACLLCVYMIYYLTTTISEGPSKADKLMETGTKLYEARTGLVNAKK
jgi:hypothetical protein